MSTALDALARALFIIVAFTLAGLVHSAWLGSRRSTRFLIPLDGGARLRGRRVFGDNKTVRGFIVMIPAAAVAFVSLFAAIAISVPNVATNLWQLSMRGYAVLGAWAGLGFMLGELPNSFVKRQLDVAPGQSPRGRTAALVSFIVDRLDSIIGMLLAITLAAPTPWLTWAFVILIGPAIHFAFSVLLYRIGVKERAA
jgi:hypothetical protein